MFSGPSDFVLKGIRKTVNGFLPGTVVIQAWIPQNDGAGGFTEGWTAVAGGTVAGRIDPISYGQLETLALAEGLKIQYHITVPYDAPVSVGNRFLTGGAVVNGVYSGTVPYNIRTLQSETTRLAFVRCACSRDV